jgi:hypothetical protein
MILLRCSIIIMRIDDAFWAKVPPNNACNGARDLGSFKSLCLANQTDRPAPAEAGVRLPKEVVEK